MSFYDPQVSDEEQPREHLFQELWKLIEDPRQRSALQRMPIVHYVERAMDEAERSHHIALADVALEYWPALKWVLKASCVNAVCCVVVA